MSDKKRNPMLSRFVDAVVLGIQKKCPKQFVFQVIIVDSESGEMQVGGLIPPGKTPSFLRMVATSVEGERVAVELMGDGERVTVMEKPASTPSGAPPLSLGLLASLLALGSKSDPFKRH
jgi:hypothetical protein